MLAGPPNALRWGQPRLPKQVLFRPTKQIIRAVSGIPDAAPPPYSLLSTAVYSLVTEDPEQPGRFTMNIVTYASPVSIKPERHYALGLYVGTLSHSNMLKSRRGVLQILQQQHAPLVPLLGRRSGRDVDKLAELRASGWALAHCFGLPVLADAVGAMELVLEAPTFACGDHEVALCRVAGHTMLAQPSAGLQPLYTDYLREHAYL